MFIRDALIKYSFPFVFIHRQLYVYLRFINFISQFYIAFNKDKFITSRSSETQILQREFYQNLFRLLSRVKF